MASCSISAFDASGAGSLRTIVNVGELGPGEVARPRDERYPLAGFPKVAAVLRQQRGYVVAVDDRDADRASVALLEALGKHSQVGVPLLRDGEVWGELWCASSTRLTAADLPHFYRVAAEVSALVAAARRDGLLLRLERVDALTGLADEVALRDHLRALAGAGGPAAAALVVGELERHPGAGSAELEGLADVLRELADPEAGDLVARVGPARTAILLPARDEPAGAALAAAAARRPGPPPPGRAPAARRLGHYGPRPRPRDAPRHGRARRRPRTVGGAALSTGAPPSTRVRQHVARAPRRPLPHPRPRRPPRRRPASLAPAAGRPPRPPRRRRRALRQAPGRRRRQAPRPPRDHGPRDAAGARPAAPSGPPADTATGRAARSAWTRSLRRPGATAVPYACRGSVTLRARSRASRRVLASGRRLRCRRPAATPVAPPPHTGAVPGPRDRPPPSGPDATVLAAGDITGCHDEAEATARLLDARPEATVLALGDNAYGQGTAQQYADCYDPTWGRAKARTLPAPGNHEYDTPGATGYFGYFGAVAGPGYYSADRGTWHLVSLNSEIDMSTASAQYRWLEADLAAHPAACTLAFWHRPRFSVGSHGDFARRRRRCSRCCTRAAPTSSWPGTTTPTSAGRR